MSLTNEKFIEFMDYYINNEIHYDSITEISKSKSPPFDPLVRNDFRMLSLDDLCKESNSFSEFNTPSTTDALWYKEDEETGELTLYIIEFKFFSLQNSMDKNRSGALLKKVQSVNNLLLKDRNYPNGLFNDDFFKDFNFLIDHFGDTAEFKLKLKPVESLIYVLPELYKNFCGHDDDEDAEDFKEFLKGINKKLYVFLTQESTFDLEAFGDNIQDKKKKKGNKGRYKDDKSRNRGLVKGSGLHLQFIRYKNAKIIDDYEIKSRYQFKKFLEDEKLID